MTLKKGKVTNNFQMDRNIQVNLEEEPKMEKAHFNGRMGKFMKGNGRMEESMGVECGKALRSKVTLGSGRMESHKALVYTFQIWGIVMKVSLRTLKSKVWVHRDFTMARHTWENTERTAQTARVSTFGLMGATTKATSPTT